MPTYTITAGRMTVASEIAKVGEVLRLAFEHFGAMNIAVTSINVGTGATAGMIRVTVTPTLTAAQLAHLGLSV